MTTPKCNDGPLTKEGSKSLVEVVTVETKSVVASNAEVKNTACKVTKDTHKQAPAPPAKCPEKYVQNSAVNYNNKAKPRDANSNQRRSALDSGEKEVCGQKQEKNTSVTTKVCEHSANSNNNTGICRNSKDSHLPSVFPSKHSKLKPPSACTSGSISSTSCSIPKPGGGPRAKTISTSTSTAGPWDGNMAVNVNTATEEPSLKGTGAIPTALRGQMGDIIEQHPRQCKDNQSLLQCNSEVTVQVEARNQPVEAPLDMTGLGSDVLVGEQQCSQCSGNFTNAGPCNEAFESTKTGFVEGTKGDMAGSKVLQEEPCTEIRPNVIGNARGSPQRAGIMTSNKAPHKGIQNNSSQIDEQLHSSNHSKLPGINSDRNCRLDVKSECNSPPAQGPSPPPPPHPNRSSGYCIESELATVVPGRDNERQLGKSSADGVNPDDNDNDNDGEGLNPPTASVSKSSCSVSNDSNSATSAANTCLNQEITSSSWGQIVSRKMMTETTPTTMTAASFAS